MVESDDLKKAVSRNYNYWLPWTNPTGERTNSDLYIGYNDYYSGNENGYIRSLNDKDGDGILSVSSSYTKRYGYSSSVRPAYIGDGTTVSTYGIKKLIFPSTTLTIGANAFKGNTQLEIVDLTATKITTISDYAFYGCTNLKQVLLPDTVTTIGQYAFANCVSLISNNDTGIINLKNVVTINQYAFSGCSNAEFKTVS